ncbi:MarR family winged helix-turn-helix transcriptional regulator [Streptomyces sp. NPDC016675]|uniref:MarR family winged helix-turn-helix transcriptional regulator n=1 Tax=Streptomyces sp. NPDC016675 TaxID=3364970 RepID=UPI0037012BFE
MASHHTDTTTTLSSASSCLEEDLAFALGVISRVYAKALDAAVEDIPGGARGHFVLAAAVRGEACSQRSLGERLGVDRTVMTYLLNDLEEANLVERCTDPGDRRSWRIHATSRGRQRWEELCGQAEAVERQVLSLLPEEDRPVFRGLLCTLAGALNRREPE